MDVAWNRYTDRDTIPDRPFEPIQLLLCQTLLQATIDVDMRQLVDTCVADDLQVRMRRMVLGGRRLH